MDAESEERVATEFIIIRVDARVAHAFNAAPEERRHKLEQLFSLRLLEAAQTNEALETVMPRISHNAQQRGLTPELLQDILDDAYQQGTHANIG